MSLGPLRSRALLVVVLAWGGLVGGCGGEEGNSRVTVYAAKSLQDVLPQVATAWKGDSGREVAFDFDATSRLVPKILEGAPADAFFSADEGWMDKLAAGGKVLAPSRVVVARNELVFVVPAAAKDAPASAAALPGGLREIALAGENVPAGKYAKAALSSLGRWKDVEPRVVRGDDVRVTLRWVAAGEAEGGVVYRTDALAEKRVRVAFAFPPDTHPPVVYPAAAVKGAKQESAGAEFVAYCRGPVAQEIFRRFGFPPAGR
jgi:molybdate transport system substrate-binding protein